LKQVIWVYIFYYVGVLPFIPLAFDCFSIPLPTDMRTKEMERHLGKRFARALGFLTHTPAMWAHLQRRGVLVLGWVLNDRSEFEQTFHWPINGIMTDDPISFQKFLQDKDSQAMAYRVTW
jgi:hypothetical protein